MDLIKSQHIVILFVFHVLNWYFCRKITIYCEYERDRKDYQGTQEEFEG